ncbi:MAG: hypothetical protein CR997_09940 [Acidobacteria bacterium]|nr:MAG: hypothetical protein CR997_09940 [Acidobacteriota bacterium]
MIGLSQDERYPGLWETLKFCSSTALFFLKKGSINLKIQSETAVRVFLAGVKKNTHKWGAHDEKSDYRS